MKPARLMETMAATSGRKFCKTHRNGRSGRLWGILGAMLLGFSLGEAQTTINVPGDHGTIQAAIDAASPGDVIEVDDGTYNENLNVTKALTLKSVNGSGAVTIQGSSAQSTAAAGGNLGTVCIFSNSVSIGTSASDGFTIIGYDVSTPGIEHAAIYIKSSASTGLAILGNEIVADGEAGITAEYGSTQEIEIGHNTFSGKTYVGTTVGGDSSVQFTTPNVPRSMIYFGGNNTNIWFHSNVVGGSVGGMIDGTTDTYYNTGATIDCNGATSLLDGAVIEDNTFTIPSWASLRARGPYSTIQNNTFDSSGAGGLAVGTYYANTADDVYSGNTYISGPGDLFLAGDGSSTVEFPGNLADYEIVFDETSSGTFIRATGSDRTIYLAAQETLTFDDQNLATSSLTVPTVRNVPSVYATIQAAITAASAGDIINVAAGTYAESVSLNKSVTLLGSNAGVHPTVGNHPTATVGTRGPETILSYGNGPGAITVTADDVTLDGLKITSTGQRIIDTYADADRFTMRNCIWENTSGSTPQGTMQFGGGSHVDSLFEYNIFDNGETALLYTAGDFDGLVMQYNLINCEGDAVFWTAASLDDGVIRGNEFDGTIDGVPGVGFNTVNIGQAGNLLIEDNYVHDIHYTAFQVGMIGGQVLNNTFENTYPYSGNPVLYGGYDLYFWGGAWGTALSANNVISGNSFSYNTSVDGPVRAIRLAGPENAGDPAIDASTFTIENNLFYDGGAYAGTPAIRHQGDQGTAVDASLNYWGTPTPDLDSLIEGNGIITSYWADAALTDLRSGEVWVDDDFTAATPGWGLTHFASISDGIAAAISGGTVSVAAGTYNESPLINKSLTLQSVGGRDVTTIVLATGQNDNALTIEGPGNDVTVDGFTIEGRGGTTNVTVEKDLGTINITNNRIQVGSSDGGFDAGIGLLTHSDNSSDTDVLNVSDNIFDTIGSDGKRAFYINPGVDQFVFQNNQILGNFTSVSIAQAKDGLVEDNTVTGTGSSSGLGTWGYPDATLYGHTTFRGNTISGTSTAIGIFDSQNISIEENDLSGNGIAVALLDYGATIPPDISTISVTNNNLSSTVGLDNGFATAVNASPNYWGAADGPSGSGPGTGASVGANVAYSPWWVDAAMTELAYDSGSFTSDYTVGPGETLEVPESLSIGGPGSPTNFTVNQGTLIAGDLDLADGSVLDVVDGELQIGGSTIAGSFTFFNSLGSVNFNDDVSISGSAEGLILISDVHVADGATITVDGTLVIDGSVVDSTGTFDLVVNDGASFTMARTVFDSGAITIDGDDARITDNRFVNSTIAIGATAENTGVYHNITDDAGFITGTGTGTVTLLDGWGNVSSAANTFNNLLLDLDISGLAADRTQDGDGNAYIQPGDVLFGTINISALQAKISGVEMLLGYSTDYLTAATLGLAPDWNTSFEEIYNDSDVIGKVDASLGLSTSFADPSGTDADQEIADLELTAGTLEGETLFFQRVKLASDTFSGDTRLTTGGATPTYLAPFTANSGTITIDGTDPVIDTTTQTITQDSADVNTDTNPGAITIQGPVLITGAARDALAGIDDVDVVVELVGPATYAATQTGTSAVTIGGEDYTEYAFSYDVVASTQNGVYDVQLTVTDRSGNQSVQSLGAVEINKNAVNVGVQLEGVGTAVTRDVVFVFTDASDAVIETRTVGVDFDATGVGGVTFADVDGASANLSAKTAWNLRQRLPISFDGDGQATVDFTGSEQLPGADLNGDNAVNMLDYSILRFYWLKADPTADITADGAVNMTDFNILQANFYTLGDAE